MFDNFAQNREAILSWFFALAAFSFLFIYSNKFLRGRDNDVFLRSRIGELEKQLEAWKNLRVNDIKRISYLENQVNSGIISSISDSFENENLVEKIKANIINDATNQTLESIRDVVERDYNRHRIITPIEQQSKSTLTRLQQQLSSLNGRARLSLSTGVGLGGIGISLVLYIIFSTKNPATDDLPKFLINYIPRLSAVFLIEVFAYFFLRTYKEILSEIKYLQNEITSIEFRLLSLNISVLRKNDDFIKDVLAKLISTERNIILEKGQTTGDIEVAKIESKEAVKLESILEKIEKILHKK